MALPKPPWNVRAAKLCDDTNPSPFSSYFYSSSPSSSFSPSPSSSYFVFFYPTTIPLQVFTALRAGLPQVALQAAERAQDPSGLSRCGVTSLRPLLAAWLSDREGFRAQYGASMERECERYRAVSGGVGGGKEAGAGQVGGNPSLQPLSTVFHSLHITHSNIALQQPLFISITAFH